MPGLTHGPPSASSPRHHAASARTCRHSTDGVPTTTACRGHIAALTRNCGDLQLFTELLPDQERVLGPGHPNVVATRSHIGHCTDQCGDPAGDG